MSGKRIWSLVVVVVFAVMMAGCGKGKEDQGGKTAGPVDPSKLKVAVALGWMANESGWRQKQGYVEALAAIGVPEQSITYFDANYDAVLQSQQIQSIIESKPDLLFIVPANADGLSEAVHDALDAGIAVFFSDGTVFGCENDVISEVICDNYSNGYAVMEYLAKRLNYKGNICLIKLDPQPAWKPRSDAAKDVIAKYPDMKIVGEWSWDPTGVNTPRQAMDGFLAANPRKGSIDAVWSAWDTACFEAIEACKAAGQTEIIFGGHDGGLVACEALLENGQFVVSVGPGIMSQAATLVNSAIDYLNGKQVKRNNFAESTILERESLLKVTPGSGQNLGDYDRPGIAKQWGLPEVPTVQRP
jgi:ribose transport system substrate-binding protein